jgi:osmotically-inducible protein OsmY
MRLSNFSIQVALAIGVAGSLAGCSDVTLSTTESAARINSLRDAYSAEADPGRMRDALLAARLTDELKGDATTSDLQIYVSVSEAHARLSGFVDTAAEKLRAGALASATEGIEDVDNRLILRYHADALQDPIAGARVRL